MEFYIKKNATLPVLKVEICKDGRSDFNLNSFLDSNYTFYISLFDNTVDKILFSSKECYVTTEVSPFGGETLYYLNYQFTNKDTIKEGKYEVQISVSSENGVILLPLQEKFYVNIIDSFAADNSSFSDLYSLNLPCCGFQETFDIDGLTLDAYYHSGSLIIDYVLTSTKVYDQDIRVNFTNVLEVITGTTIQIITGVTINSGEIRGITQVIFPDYDYNNLTQSSSLSSVEFIDSVPNIIFNFDSHVIFNTVPPTPTPTRTPTPTVTPTKTSTSTPTPTQTPSITPSITPSPTNPCVQYLTDELGNFILTENGDYIISEINTCITPTPTKTTTPTQTVTPTNTTTQTSTVTPTNTTTPTPTQTQTVTPTNTTTQTPSITPSSTNPCVQFLTDENGNFILTENGNYIISELNPCITPTPTRTPTSTITPTITKTSTPSPTSTNTPTPSVTPTITSSPIPPSIVTNGLILYYDFSNPVSYSGSGVSVNDLSTSNNNGTVVNDYGHISYVSSGSNSYFIWDSNAGGNGGSNSFGSSIWTTSANTYLDFTMIIQPDFSMGGIGGIFGFPNDKSLRVYNNSWLLPNPGNGDDWASQPTTFYVNGQVSNQMVPGWNIIGGTKNNTNLAFPNNNTLYIGTSSYDNRNMQGKIALVLMYNRALTGQEQLQNYNFFKNRFGL